MTGCPLQRLVSPGSAFGKLTLQIGYVLFGVGRIFRRCWFRPSPLMGEGMGGGDRLYTSGSDRSNWGGAALMQSVGDKPADRHLSAKPTAFGLPRPQHLPEPLFGFGHVTAEVPGALARTRTQCFLHH